MLGAIIKVFDDIRWAKNFLHQGEMKFSHVTVMQKIEDIARNDEREGNSIETLPVNIQKKVPFARIGERHILDLEKMAADGKDIRGKNVILKLYYTPDIFIYSAAFILESYDSIKARFDELKKFGSYAVVIVNCQEFVSRVQTAIPSVNIGKVVYTDTPHTIFEKPVKYTLESELRFVIQKEQNTEKIIYKHLGSLQDIAYICNISYFNDLALVLESKKIIIHKGATMDTSEKRFESDIESFLISDAGGYEQFSYLNPDGHRIHKYVYDKEKAIYPEVLIHFIAKSQPKAWARYQKYYGEDAPEKLYRRLENSINENGLVHVLKYGIEDMGIKLKVCYFKPESSLNEEQNELYELNVLGCTRQFAYSPANHNTIDMVLSLNGIPVAAFQVTTFEDYLRMLKTCTDITGRADLYEQNGEATKARIGDIVAKVPAGEAPTALVLTTYSGGTRVQASSTMTGAMLADLGVRNLVDENKSLLKDFSLESIIELNPDFIFVVPMGNDDAAAMKALEDQTAANPAWSTLSAVQNGNYVTLDPHLFQYKPNERWDQSYQVLYDALYA